MSDIEKIAPEIEEKEAELPTKGPACTTTTTTTSVPIQIAAPSAPPEEPKLRTVYPTRPMAGHSAFLQKRLNKGMKYFDSGDYQMAKQNPTKSRKLPLLAQTTGDAIPTPESVPVRKTSIVQHNKLTSTAS